METQTKDNRKKQGFSGTDVRNGGETLSPRSAKGDRPVGNTKRPSLPKRRSSSGMEGAQKHLQMKENDNMKSPRDRRPSTGVRRNSSGRDRSNSNELKSSGTPPRRNSQGTNTPQSPNILSASWGADFFNPRKQQVTFSADGCLEGGLEMSQHTSLRSLEHQIVSDKDRLESNRDIVKKYSKEKEFIDAIVGSIVEWISLVKGVNRLSKSVPEMQSVRKACVEILAQLQNNNSIFCLQLESLKDAGICNFSSLNSQIEKFKNDIKCGIQNSESLTAKYVEDIRYTLGYIKGTLIVTRDMFY